MTIEEFSQHRARRENYDYNKVSNLHFSYQEDFEVLKEINVEFDHRSTAIIGQNGAGETTFVKLLKGLLLPTQGIYGLKTIILKKKIQ